MSQRTKTKANQVLEIWNKHAENRVLIVLRVKNHLTCKRENEVK